MPNYKLQTTNYKVLPSLIFIVGPTSSGKTRVAAELAKRADGEVISCDSMQIYKGMEIISQAPQEEVLNMAPHHLIGIVEPEEEFSAVRYAEEAKKVLKDILSRKKLPIFAGGTGLYMKALLDGIFLSPAKDEVMREKYARLAEIEGSAFLHDKLKRVDPETAAKLHPNDLKRIIRALEVSEQTGKTISALKPSAQGIVGEYDVKIFGLELDREVMYRRTDATVERMFDAGLIGEVESLLARPLGKTAQKALGIKEVASFISGEVELESVKKELKRKTRNYAKRQMTWFRADRRVVWVNADRAAEDIAEEIEKRCS